MSGNSPGDVFQPHQPVSEAQAQIGRWVPTGIGLADAARALEQHDFSCQPATPASAGIHASVLCQFEAQPPPKETLSAPDVPVNWFITLNSNDGSRLSETQVTRLPNDIGG